MASKIDSSAWVCKNQSQNDIQPSRRNSEPSSLHKSQSVQTSALARAIRHEWGNNKRILPFCGLSWMSHSFTSAPFKEALKEVESLAWILLLHYWAEVAISHGACLRSTFHFFQLLCVGACCRIRLMEAWRSTFDKILHRITDLSGVPWWFSPHLAHFASPILLPLPKFSSYSPVWLYSCFSS